jgi:hypothetical protein
MDSSNLNRSPPQFSRDVILEATTAFNDLSKKLQSKRKALAKLADVLPKSVSTQIDLKLSQTLIADLPDTATALQTRFTEAIQLQQETVRSIIIASVQAEIGQLESKLQKLLDATDAKLYDYFKQLFDISHINSPTSMSFNEAIANNIADPAVLDYLESRSFLQKKLARLQYEQQAANLYAHIKKKKNDEKKQESIDIEMDTSKDVLVASLVKKSITKETRALRKEVNELRAIINKQKNSKVSLPGKKTSTLQKQKDGERVQEKPKDSNSKNKKPKITGKAKQTPKKKQASRN